MIQAPAATASEIAPLTAAMLLDIGAIEVARDEPFTLASGRPSPVYVDCRRIIAFPRVRAAVTGFLATRLAAEVGVEAFDVVAGGETAGIPFAAFLADRLALPMAYIRKTPKGYGRNARIEGRIAPDARVLLVEDLATDGGSKLSFVHAVREAGAACAHTAVVFSYGIFPDTRGRLAEAGVTLHALCDWHDVLRLARERRLLEEPALKTLAAFIEDPHAWQARHV